jgi:hypothetical protein
VKRVKVKICYQGDLLEIRELHHHQVRFGLVWFLLIVVKETIMSKEVWQGPLTCLACTRPWVPFPAESWCILEEENKLECGDSEV